jgi:hypothetical protein
MMNIDNPPSPPFLANGDGRFEKYNYNKRLQSG